MTENPIAEKAASADREKREKDILRTVAFSWHEILKAICKKTDPISVAGAKHLLRIRVEMAFENPSANPHIPLPYDSDNWTEINADREEALHFLRTGKLKVRAAQLKFYPELARILARIAEQIGNKQTTSERKEADEVNLEGLERIDKLK